MITHFTGILGAAVETGQVLIVAGKTIDCARFFEVELSGDKDDIGCSVQLGLSVRFDEDCIVRRTRSASGACWDEEEREENRTGDASNPIVAGEPFRIYILIGDASFIISVDGQPFCTYAFRLAVDGIQAIRVHGDVQCVSQIDQRRVFPVPWPTVQFDDRLAEFSSELPSSMRPGHIVVITAIPFGSPSGWFDIRVLEGVAFRQAFHFNPRFGAKAFVVRNAQTEDSRWNFQLEDRTGEMPFTLDVQFTMAIAFTRNEFRVAINGTEFCTYRSTSQLSELYGIKMYGSFGGHIEVTSLDHVVGGPADCFDYERYSDPGVEWAEEVEDI